MGNEIPKEMDFWTKEEYLKFSEAMMDKPRSFYAFEMLYWCGIRSGELLALTAADFDFQKQTVTISKTYHRSKGRDIITSPKTAKSNRTVKMPPFLCEEMQEYIKMLYDIKPDERLFTVTKSYLNHEMERGAKQAGVKKIRVHDIRHSHVSLLINIGFSVLAIGERVGHEAEKITYRYAHLFPTVQTEMAEKLEMERMEKEDSDGKNHLELEKEIEKYTTGQIPKNGRSLLGVFSNYYNNYRYANYIPGKNSSELRKLFISFLKKQNGKFNFDEPCALIQFDAFKRFYINELGKLARYYFELIEHKAKDINTYTYEIDSYSNAARVFLSTQRRSLYEQMVIEQNSIKELLLYMYKNKRESGVFRLLNDMESLEMDDALVNDYLADLCEGKVNNWLIDYVDELEEKFRQGIL